MAKLSEHELFAAVVGEQLDECRLVQLDASIGSGTGNYRDCICYLLSSPEHWSDQHVQMFRITPALVSGWQNHSIAYGIQLHVKDGCIAGGRIIKYKETGNKCSARSFGYEVEPNQQELRVTKRILEYLVEDGE